MAKNIAENIVVLLSQSPDHPIFMGMLYNQDDWCLWLVHSKEQALKILRGYEFLNTNNYRLTRQHILRSPLALKVNDALFPPLLLQNSLGETILRGLFTLEIERKKGASQWMSRGTTGMFLGVSFSTGSQIQNPCALLIIKKSLDALATSTVYFTQADAIAGVIQADQSGKNRGRILPLIQGSSLPMADGHAPIELGTNQSLFLLEIILRAAQEFK